ncbi:MaoC family dehydratase N-terminal domain-containing protein [Candidimonas humi]|uniref:MaoC family dehydratase N-terminal domain-containing protein n=1 Tax=Candidimonas humi TaxID=683355 RepID=A0ABV8P2Y1_9BURK|nr:MaoC family dehydratase N-terminal domain-containing protein [Candidimonas humi]MBV6306667.1 MaoC family dehydratase N-terminal domain-containing protein [Candidimonas humi]
MTDLDPMAWKGRSETCPDNLDAGHAQRVALALGETAPAPGEALPPLWHWAFFVAALPYDMLGEDGHARRGGFMPPAANRNRMWAGGRVKFPQPLRVGEPAERRSTIAEVVEKEGRTGRLLFVTVRHEYLQGGRLCVDEEQDVVYREPSPPKLQGSQAAPEHGWLETITPSTVMLFRYSAVTFNGHRIHYDDPYVRQAEGYPGLVVHGPLIATLMARAYARANPQRPMSAFSYRGLRPLIAPRPFQVAGRLDGDGAASLWAEQDGMLAHQAHVEYGAPR